MTELLANFVSLFLNILWLAILGRTLMSWFSPGGNDPLSQFLYQITEPVLKPIRQIVPPLGMFDLTPMIALIVLQIIRPILVNLLLTA